MDLNEIAELQTRRTQLFQEAATLTETIRQKFAAAEEELAAFRRASGIWDNAKPKTRKPGTGAYQRTRTPETRARRSEASRAMWARKRANGELVGRRLSKPAPELTTA